MSLNRQELLQRVATGSGESKAACDRVLTSLLNTITKAVAAGEKVTFTGFGSFEKAPVAARGGRNPKTGEKITLAETCRPKFRAGTAFKAAVRGTGTD